jgi:glutamate formiminotransferase/glutamate formiminotransferase/formiminotetrahydrofolate cyclodeaminase
MGSPIEPPTLLAVPNVSEGRDAQTIAAIGAAFAGESTGAGVRLLDVHTDADHHRTVFTLAGRPLELADALVRGARVALERIDVVARAEGPAEEAGQHPHVGAIDVAPIVYPDPALQGAACALALVLGDRLAEELGLPVFLYGELSGEDALTRRTRAQLRRGGIAGLRERMADPERPLHPDFGPSRVHPSGGATLVAARPPLVAFNLQLAPGATVDDARAIAARIREGGSEGLPGLRAVGVALGDGRAQVSMNVERPYELPLAIVVEAVRAHAPVADAELVGVAPSAAFAGFPEDVPIPGFDPAGQLLENALGS